VTCYVKTSDVACYYTRTSNDAMVDMVVSTMLSFPKGASWNLPNFYGSPGHTRHDIWQAALETWNLQVPCDHILAEYYGHLVSIQCNVMLCFLVVSPGFTNSLDVTVIKFSIFKFRSIYFQCPIQAICAGKMNVPMGVSNQI